jgi:hypothetical protein
MRYSVHPHRLTLLPRAGSLALAAVVSGVLVAGCGGGSGTPTAPAGGGASTHASSAASATATSTAGSSNTTGQGAASTASTAPDASGSGQLAYARCMRSHGVPNFPDPDPGGGFEFSAGEGIDPSSPAFRAANATCRKILPDGGPPAPGSTTHPSPQTLAKLVRIAQCMREHGVAQFPDPRTSVPADPFSGGPGEITDFDGAILLFPATMNVQAPAYKQALTACGAPPLGLPH